MSSSTTILDLLSVGQAGKEPTVNALFDAASPSMLFGRRASQCSGLAFGYYGGVMQVDGVLTVIANGTVTVTDDATNYVEASRSGVVTANTTAYTAGSIPLYTLVAAGGVVTSYTDNRAWVVPMTTHGKASVAVTTANVTLTNAQAACDYLITTGALTGNRNVIVPAYWCADVFCNNTDSGGPWTTTFKGASGTGIVVAKTMRARLRHDGTNVVRISADV